MKYCIQTQSGKAKIMTQLGVYSFSVCFLICFPQNKGFDTTFLLKKCADYFRENFVTLCKLTVAQIFQLSYFCTFSHLILIHYSTSDE